MVAEAVYERTKGVKGLACYLCSCAVGLGHTIDKDAGSTAFRDAVLKHFRTTATNLLVQTTVYSHIVLVLKQVYPRPSQGIAVILTPQQEYQQKVLQQVLQYGSCKVQEADLDKLETLLEDGLLTAVGTKEQTPSQSLLNSISGVVTLAVPAPILQTCLLRNLAMPSQSTHMGPVPAGQMDCFWVIIQVIRNLDLNMVLRPQSVKSDGNPHEYCFQAQFYLHTQNLVTMNWPLYKVLVEARQHESQQYNRRRLDGLLLGDDLQSYGLQLLVSGNRKEIDDHMERGRLYSILHGCKINGVWHPCIVYVINLYFKSSRRERYIPSAMPNVHFLDVELPEDNSVRADLYLNGATQPQTADLYKPAHAHVWIHRLSDS